MNTIDKIIKHISCPVCGKQLIPLEPQDEKGIYDFWCDICDIDIHVEVNGEKKGD